MKKTGLLILCLSVCLIVIAQPAPLRLNLKTGETYSQVSNASMTIEQVIQGMPFDMAMEVFGVLDYHVQSAADGIYQIEVSHRNLRLSVEMMNETMVFSSEKPDTHDIVSILLSEMKNYPFHIALTDRGKVVSVTNMSDWLEPTLEKLSGYPEDEILPMIDQVLQSYGEEAYKGNIEMVMAIYPDQEVTPGDQWNIKTRLNSSLTADIDTRFTLSRRNKQTVIINGDSNVKTDDTAPPLPVTGGTIQYEMAGTIKSEFEIDALSGWIVNAKFDQHLEGNNTLTTNEAMGTIIVPMKIKSVMVVGDSGKTMRSKKK